MASEDAPVDVVDVDAPVIPDRVASAIHATTNVLESVERFMHGWTAADREVFKQRVASDVAKFESLSLSELDVKITRHTTLMSSTVNKAAPFSVTNGKLEGRAQLNATLIAMRQCQAVAQRKAQSADADVVEASKNWLESARQNQQESQVTNRKSAPARGGVVVDLYAPRSSKPSRGTQQVGAANGKKPLPMQASLPPGGKGFKAAAAAANGQRQGSFSSLGGAAAERPPGLTPDQLGNFGQFKCVEGKSGGGGGGGRAATKRFDEEPFGHYGKQGGSGAAGGGRAKSSAATAQPARATRQTRRCDGCKQILPQSDVNQSISLDMAVCNDCEREFNQTGHAERAPREEKTAFHLAMEKSQRPEPKKKKQPAEPVHIDLLSDGEDDADAEDKPVAETRSTRPVRAAAAAAQSLSQRLAGMKALYPQHGDSHAVEVSASDLFHLQPSEFLNDTVIDLYLKKLEQELPEPLKKRVHFFNTFFYKKLTQKTAKPPADENEGDRFKHNERSAHDRVKKWTKHVDIFSKDFVFVPVHSGLHWSLVIICHAGVVPPPSAPADDDIIDVDGPTRAPPPQAADPAPGSPVTQEDVQAAAPCAPDDPSVMDVDAASKPAEEDITAMLAAGAEQPAAAAPAVLTSILHLDSMGGGHSTSTLSEKLRSYLSVEWERLALDNPESVPARSGQQSRSFKSEVKLKRLALPQQNNSSDCGCFLLTYIEHFLKCMPAQLTSEHVKGLEKGKGISLQDCPDFLGEHWFDPVRGFNMREHLTNVILDLFVEQAGEPPDDAARERLAKAQEALTDGLASEEREAEAAKEKEVKYLEKLKRRLERKAAGAAAQDVVALDSDSEKSELPRVLTRPQRTTRGKKGGDAGVAAAAADEEDEEPRRNSGRTRRASARDVPPGYEKAGAPSDDDDFEPEKPEKPEKPPKKPRKRLAPAAYEDEDDEAVTAAADAALQTAARKSHRAAAAGASAPADAIDVDAVQEEGAPGFVADEGAPGFPVGYLPPLPPNRRSDTPPPAAAPSWGQPVPVSVPKSPEFNLVPQGSEPMAEQQPLKAPPQQYGRKRSKSAPAAPEQHAAADVITLDDEEEVEPADEPPAAAANDGTPSL